MRHSTEAEVQQALALAGFENLWLGGHGDPTAEIYVAARTPSA
ncbi:MAG TPA: hypothetical protein VGG65_04960 [Thermoanaerobaculia bacterium]